jgi:mannose-6-phosphate isomerase
MSSTGPEGTRRGTLERAVRAPLRLPYHPLHRFYEGGALTRAFRGLPERPADWWSEDWVGSCTLAGNPDPDGRPQGLSRVDVEGVGPVPLVELIEAFPEEMVGVAFAGRWGPISGFLVKLLSPSGPVPLHAHPTRAWAGQHLGSRFGKTEAWILLETPGDGVEPAYAGIGFREGIDERAFRAAVARRDAAWVRDTSHRFPIAPGEAYVAHAGVPHYLGPGVSFIEIQEPSDHLVIPEWTEPDDAGATMGLGFDEALGMLDFRATDQAATLARARQVPTATRRSGASRELRLVGPDVHPFFDAYRLEVEDELEVDDGRFAVAIVTSGDGRIEGEFGTQPLRRGETFATAAALAHRFRAGDEPVTIVRCLGPVA